MKSSARKISCLLPFLFLPATGLPESPEVMFKIKISAGAINELESRGAESVLKKSLSKIKFAEIVDKDENMKIDLAISAAAADGALSTVSIVAIEKNGCNAIGDAIVESIKSPQGGPVRSVKKCDCLDSIIFHKTETVARKDLVFAVDYLARDFIESVLESKKEFSDYYKKP